MGITSPVFANNDTMPTKYTCEGQNVNPPIEFSAIPNETKSLALIIEDPDAPSKPWVHWFVFNIPPTTLNVDEHAIPKGGIEGYANGGTHGYEGPCPPSGTHRYLFNLYALDTMLEIPDTADRDMFLKKSQGHVLEKATITSLYRLHKN